MSSHILRRLHCSPFSVPKRGNRKEELEDAYDHKEDRGAGAGCFAIADGATESICADVWAKMLVEAYVANPVGDLAGWAAWLAPVRQRWCEHVETLDLPWFAEHKLEAGAAASLLGLVIEPDATWRAIAVGDSCLFQIREGKVIERFPVTRSSDFDNCPPLICSCLRKPESAPLETSGDCQAGDHLLLMTDAIAQWFLLQDEERNDALPFVQRIDDLRDAPTQQLAEIDGLREARLVRDDDTSWLHITL